MDTLFLGLHTRNLGTQTRQLINPFGGEAIVVHIDDGMTPAETHASSMVLSDAGASEPDLDGFRKVRFAGGNYAGINLDRIGGEIGVEGGLTPDVTPFIYQLALASGMLITSTTEPGVVAVLPGQRHPGIDTRWPGAVSINDADELLGWIKTEVSNGRIAGPGSRSLFRRLAHPKIGTEKRVERAWGRRASSPSKNKEATRRSRSINLHR